jgi:hypothetical protein
MTWVHQNWKSYFFRHMVGLLRAGIGQKKKANAMKTLITQVRTLADSRRTTAVHRSYRSGMHADFLTVRRWPRTTTPRRPGAVS